jgi:hypothetical protein
MKELREIINHLSRTDALTIWRAMGVSDEQLAPVHRRASADSPERGGHGRCCNRPVRGIGRARGRGGLRLGLANVMVRRAR